MVLLMEKNADIYWTIYKTPEDFSFTGIFSPALFLSEKENEKLQDYRFPKRRFEWLSGRWALKNLIRLSFSEYANLALKEIEIANEPGGAPFILLHGERIHDLKVSLSHRGGLAAAAVIRCPESRLGIDLELPEPRPRCFIEDYFTANEINFLEFASEPYRNTLVNLFWSAREAFLKGEGIGLRVDTRCLEVRLEANFLSIKNFSDHKWMPFELFDLREKPYRYSGFWQADAEKVLTIFWNNQIRKRSSCNLYEIKI